MTSDFEYEDKTDGEYLEEIQDTLTSLQIGVNALNNNPADRSKPFARLKGDVESIRSLDHAANSPYLELAARRLHDYVTDLSDPTQSQVDDISIFLDVMQGILDGEVTQSTDTAEFFRSLPVRRPMEFEDLDHLDVEILVVDPQRSSQRIVQRELQNCGYRVTGATRSLEALELAVRTRPDMVVSSVVLDVLSGVDLACALAAIPATKGVHVALLTSFSGSDDALKHLPKNAAVLNKGKNFGDDLADALSRFGIT